MSLRSWEEIATLDYPDPPFLIDPYIPRAGKVLLWGDTSIGKSPVTWEMARAVGTGTHFFGLPATPGRVLYVEVDTPEQGMGLRLRKVVPAPNVWFLFMEPLSLPNITGEEIDALRSAKEEVKPDLVIVDTLRQVHDFDDRESRVPKVVYTFFKKMFSGCALLFNHHERKTPLDPRVTEIGKESFSGSKAFLNDSQVGLQLGVFRRRDGRENLRLTHYKSQVSERIRPLPLKLHPDGSTLTCPLYEELLEAYMALHDERAALPKGEVDRMMVEKFGISLSTARARRVMVESGKFPGSREWLSAGEEEEDA